MIRGKCFTDEEDYKDAKWPTTFAALPAEGNYVKGVQGGEPVRLRVAEISHGLIAHAGERMTQQVPLVEIKLIK